jgi:hypothetical protein
MGRRLRRPSPSRRLSREGGLRRRRWLRLRCGEAPRPRRLWRPGIWRRLPGTWPETRGRMLSRPVVVLVGTATVWRNGYRWND